MHETTTVLDPPKKLDLETDKPNCFEKYLTSYPGHHF